MIVLRLTYVNNLNYSEQPEVYGPVQVSHAVGTASHFMNRRKFLLELAFPSPPPTSESGNHHQQLK